MFKKILPLLFACSLFFSAFAEEENNKKFNSDLQKTFFIYTSTSHVDYNPHTSSYTHEAQIINALQEGLFSYEPKTLEPVPAIASEYRISRDKKKWTFTIRENIKFSNGQPITAQSVVDSWLKLQKTPYAPYASLLDCIKGMKDYRENKTGIEGVGLKANGQKLTVTLNTPTAYLLRLLCHHAFSVYTGEENVYSGAYTLTHIDNTGLTLSKNENYWDKENVALSEIKIVFSDNLKDNSWMYNTGRADWIISAFSADTLLSKDDININNVFGTSYLFFTCKNEIWNRSDFRNALLTAIPWKELRKNNLVPASTLVYPLPSYPKVDGISDYNTDEAIEMMEEARANAKIPSDKKLEISFGIVDSEYSRATAKILKDAWLPLGVELITFNIREEDYFTSIPYLNYDIFSYAWIGDFADPVAFLELFRDGSTLNQTAWKNEEFTKKLKLADEETDSLERYKLLSQAEQILLDDGVIMPIYHSLSYHVINTNSVGGWYTNGLDIHPFKYLYIKDHNPQPLQNIAKK